jgi:hypothetical protein
MLLSGDSAVAFLFVLMAAPADHSSVLKRFLLAKPISTVHVFVCERVMSFGLLDLSQQQEKLPCAF